MADWVFNSLHIIRLGEEIIRKLLVVLHRLVVDPRELFSVDEVIDHPRGRYAIGLDKLQ